MRVAEGYGYTRDEMSNRPRRWWPAYREGGVLLHAGKLRALRLLRTG